MDLSKIWRVNGSVRYRRLFDEAVLLHQDRAEALVLNDTAVSFLEGCDGRRDVGQIIAGMTADFQVSPDQLAADLEPFIEQLEAEGIIEAI